MKRVVLVALAILAVAVVLHLRPDPPPPPPPPAAPAGAPAPPAPAARPEQVTRLPVAEQAALLNAPGQTVDDDLATLELLLSEFRDHHGGNPVGDNAEITAALLGRNPKSLGYLPAAGPFLDSEGRLVDRWGTAYFFHALSARHMEIRSAGPDREPWTDDDPVR